MNLSSGRYPLRTWCIAFDQLTVLSLKFCTGSETKNIWYCKTIDRNAVRRFRHPPYSYIWNRVPCSEWICIFLNCAWASHSMLISYYYSVRLLITLHSFTSWAMSASSFKIFVSTAGNSLPVNCSQSWFSIQSAFELLDTLVSDKRF